MVRESSDPMLGSARAVAVVYQEFFQEGKSLKKQVLICQLCTARCHKRLSKQPLKEEWTEPKAWHLEKEYPSSLAVFHA